MSAVREVRHDRHASAPSSTPVTIAGRRNCRLSDASHVTLLQQSLYFSTTSPEKDLPMPSAYRSFAAAIAFLATPHAWSQSTVGQPIPVSINWNKTIIVSKSTPTLQVVVNPMLRAGSPIYESSFAALKDLGADYVRYVPWLPYPRLAVAELEPPTKDTTSWDFKLIDPMTKDFMDATSGHSTVMNFSTIPSWLFKTEKPVTIPADPSQVVWDYTQGTELNDPSGKELGEYYARLVSWYTRGGFTDENGKEHNSGHHYSFPIWEVLN
jgi:hypothetical protein